jgi:hypothetical protein
METQFNWKAKLFKNKYEIFQNETIAGELAGSGWKRKSAGELKGKKVLFEVRGFLKQQYMIINPDDNSVSGEMTYNRWRTKAIITLHNKTYNFQFDNFFHTKWNISNENGSLIRYEARFRHGTILSYTNDEILILTGLYIRDFQRQRAAAATAAAS